MRDRWTFGRKITVGLLMTVLFATATAVIAIVTLQSVVASKDRVIKVNAGNLVDAHRMYGARQAHAAALRGYLLAREDRYLQELTTAQTRFDEAKSRLRGNIYTDMGRDAIAAVDIAEKAVRSRVDRLLVMRRDEVPLESVIRSMNQELVPLRGELNQRMDELVAVEQRVLEQGRTASNETASSAILMVVGTGSATVLVAIAIAILLTTSLSRQIGSAVGQVQTSSAELQSTATEQATSSRQQATAMSEITTTISELLASSRQIAESAQRVAQIAGQAVGAARTGDGTVDRAQESIGAIRRQVDAVVHHMLELGRGSQHIGSVVDIVSELAEQTNILAINASIEAAGAGEAGRRFAVVADEIRKLADRVSSSAKEIRRLIDDVRTAVNTTVMATEIGSKAVDSGSRQFSEVTTSFKQIAGLIGTTTEAAREIELSTKQQTSAVEQVNGAMASVAQAARETEASAMETLQTASQLATLSRDLIRLVRQDGR